MSRPSVAEKSVVLLSGGLDSAANLAIACDEASSAGDALQAGVVLALTADYGQRAAVSEIRAARMLCDYYGVSHQTIDMRWLGALGGSALTESAISVPKIETGKLDDLSVTRGTAQAVWVPNRNGVLINTAAAFAERLGATAVAVGFNREEATTFPDNSRQFMERLCGSLELSTANHVRVISHTVDLDKREIVARLRALRRPFPFELIWSCYRGLEKACGECESCRRFARAMADTGGQ